MESLKILIELWHSYPIDMVVISIVLIILAIKYRKQLRKFLSIKFPGLFGRMKKTEPIRNFCDDNGEFFDFKSHVVVPNYNLFYDSLMKQISKSKKKGDVLKLNLCDIDTMNTEAEEALRDAIRKMILENNIRCRIIFPNTKLKSLYEEIKKLVKDKNCKSICIKKAKKK